MRHNSSLTIALHLTHKGVILHHMMGHQGYTWNHRGTLSARQAPATEVKDISGHKHSQTE